MRLKLSRRELFLLALLAVAAVVVLWGAGGPESAPVARSRSRSRAETALAPVPRIGLSRLDEERSPVAVGRRDLFAFGAPTSVEWDPEDRAPVPPPVTTTALPPGSDPAGALAARSGLAPLNLKFIGAVGNAKGVKVAVLLTERNEVLTGQQGDVVANRYRIEHIGIESVDLADVGTGQSRRIPLKGN